MAYVSRRPHAARSSSGIHSRPLAALRSLWPALFVLILVVAVVLRFPALRVPVLSYDEAGYALDGWRLLAGRAEAGPYYRAAPGYSQLLSLAQLAFGGGDVSVRLLSLLAGLGAILLCVPVGRVAGRGAVLVAAVLLAVAPFWLRLDAVVAPDGVVVFLAMLGIALVSSVHLWPWSLIGAAAVTGYLLAFGTTGWWMAAVLLSVLVIAGLRLPRKAWVTGAVAAFASSGLAGLTSFGTSRPVLPLTVRMQEGGASSTEFLRHFASSAPFLLVLLAVALVLWKRASVSRLSWLLAATGGVLLVLSVLLPDPVRPAPAAAGFVLTWAGAVLLARAMSVLVPGRELIAGALVAAGVVCISLLLAQGDAPIVAGPGNVRPVTATDPAIRYAANRVERVSFELYRLERSLEEPRGGRGLQTVVSPSVSNWALWYLRDFENLTVGSGGDERPEVRILGPGDPASSGYEIERFGTRPAEPTAVLAWRPSVWQQITPEAEVGTFEPKAKYDLLDKAPPGDRPGQLNGPVGIAVAPSGTVYVVDQANSRIQKYEPDGTYALAWGAEGDGEGQFGDAGPQLGPTGIAASDEYVWVADTWNHRIQQFRPDGTFVRAWGSFVDTGGDAGRNAASPQGFYGPRGVALGSDGLLYITDTGNKRVVVYQQTGRYVRQWGVGGSGVGELDEPVGIAVGRNGHVYVADARNRRIQVFSQAGKPLRRWPLASESKEGRMEPYVAVDRRGRVYVSDPASQTVSVYNAQGKEIRAYRTAADRTFLAPTGLAVASDEVVYIVDSALGNVLDFRVP